MYSELKYRSTIGRSGNLEISLIMRKKNTISISEIKALSR